MSGLFTPFPEWPFEESDKASATHLNCLVQWSDTAISKAKEDRFERAAYASKLANLIHETAAPTESTIYGLTGEWGSGKTSLVNLIRKDLSGLSDNWEVVDYNPWVASDPESLIAEFYRAVVEALPTNPIGKRIKDILQKTIRSIRPVTETLASLDSIASILASQIIDPIDGFVELKEIWQPEQDSWPTLYAKASEEFKRLDKQILLVVDDIDRLHSDELALLMKVVRLLGRFPRVNYLLAYDEESLLATLVESKAVGGDKDHALRFMEKIVQYPIDVPQLTSDQIENQLRIILEILSLGDIKADEKNDLEEVQRTMFGVWEKILTTPRMLRRYAALLVNWIKIYDSSEVNTVDLMILATIRIAFPSVYAQLPLYKYSLLKNSPLSVGVVSTGSKEKSFEWKDTLGKDLNILQSELLETMLSLLFPKLKNNMIIPDRRSRPRAISTEVYFDTYVLFQTPKEVIRDQYLDSILQNATGNGGVELAELVNTDEAGQASSVVEKLPDAIALLQDDAQRLQAADVLVTAAEKIEDKERRVRLVNLYGEFYFQASMALSKLDKPDAINLFDCYFRKTSLNYAVYFLDKIRYHSQGHEKTWWKSQVYEKLFEQCAEKFRVVLEEKDVTDRDLGPYSLDFLTRWQGFDDFRAVLLKDLNANKFDIFDVGVLFLTTGYSMGQEPRRLEILSLGRPLFSQYVTAEKLELVGADLEGEDISFEPADLSWTGRREAVKYALKTGRTDFHRERFGG